VSLELTKAGDLIKMQ